MRKLPLLIALLTMAGIASIARDRWADEASRRKADYLYLEAQARDAEGDNDAAFELLSESWRLNPDDKTVGYNLAVYLLQLMQNDTTVFPKAARMLADFYNAHPDDYYGAVTYGSLLEYQRKFGEAITVWENMHRYFPDNVQVTFKLAASLENVRDTMSVRRAIALYDTLGEIDGASLELVMHKMQLLYTLGDTASIVRRLDDLLAGPTGRSVENLVMAGNVHHALGNNPLADSLLHEACRVDSTSGLASYSLATFYRAVGDSVGYEREVYEALVRPSLDVEVKNELLAEYVGNHIRDSLMTDRISSLFAVLVDQYPRESIVRNTYADFLLYNRDYRGAAEQLHYSLDADPSQDKCWQMLCQLYELDKDYPASIAVAAEAAKYLPDLSWPSLVRAFDYLRLDSLDRAEGIAREWLERDSLGTSADHVNMQILLGDILYRMDRSEDAFDAYRKALDIDPDNTLALNNYAYFLALKGEELDKAKTMVERCLLIDPDNINAVDTYAWVMFMKKDYSRAREIYESALDELMSPDNVSSETFDHAGDIWFMTGDTDAAVGYWQKALELDPGNASIEAKIRDRALTIKN